MEGAQMVALLLLGTLLSSVGPGVFELGIIIGEPTGISAKLWTGEKTAVDGAIAWSLGEGNDMHIHADFLVHDFSLINVSSGQLPLYYGIGGRVRINGDARLGARIPVGLSYLLESLPMDIFLEVVPVLDLVPHTDFDIDLAIGVRYIF